MRGSSRDEITVDGVPVTLLDPALVTPVPEAEDAVRDPDGAAAAAAVVQPSGTVMRAVCALSPARLSDAGLIDAIVAVRRLQAALEAKQVEFLAEIAHRDPQQEGFLRAEVGPALRLAPGVAAERIEAAVALTGRLWDTYDLMGDGHLPATHGRILAEATGDLPDQVAAKVQEKVLRRGPGQTPGEFRACVRRAVAHVDRKDHAERHRDAVAERRVVPEPAPDGMSWVHLYLPEDGAAVVLAAVNAWATPTGPDDTRSLDQRRADAAVELAMAGLATPGVPSAHGLKPVINLTLAASTLTGADEQPGLVNGHPVPAPVARHWARHPHATWRYWAVDQAGQIQDTDPASPGRGLVTSAYTPTPRIARHVSVRDQCCIFPGCRRPAGQAQIDHRTPWPAGKTTAANLQILCKRHHDAKHATWRVTRTSNRTYRWTSPTRHTYHYRPPDHPTPEPEPPPVGQDEPPPF